MIAQCADHRIALLIDQERRRSLHRRGLYRLPYLQQIIEVPLQLFVAAADTRGAHDRAHALRDLDRLERVADLVPISTVDASGHAAGAGIVRHQHEETAGQTEEGGQRRAFVAALLLLDLDDDFLAFPEHVADVDPAAGVGTLDKVLAGDFLQRQETMTGGTVFDEGRFEAGFEPGDPALIDIGLFLFPGRGFDIEVDQPLAVDHGHAQLFFLSCVH